jgi:hypothetical protein
VQLRSHTISIAICAATSPISVANCGDAIWVSRASSATEQPVSRPPPCSQSASASYAGFSITAASAGASGNRSARGAIAPRSGGVIAIRRAPRCSTISMRTNRRWLAASAVYVAAPSRPSERISPPGITSVSWRGSSSTSARGSGRVSSRYSAIRPTLAIVALPL